MVTEPIVSIVDDDADVRCSLRQLTTSVGLQARTYQSATEFLEQHDDERPGCLILDVRLNGMSGLSIIVGELIPNLLPYLGASLVGAVTGAIFASMGLAALGLGPLREPTLGVTIYWVINQSAFLRGLWWWATVPITIVALVFIMLFLISIGLDELANPRVRRSA